MDQSFDPGASLLLVDLDDKHPAESDDLVLDDWLGGLISEGADVSDFPDDTVTSVMQKSGARDFPSAASTPDLMTAAAGFAAPSELRNRQVGPLRTAFSLGDLQALQNAPQAQWSRYAARPRLESVPEAGVEFQGLLPPVDVAPQFHAAQAPMPGTSEATDMQTYSMQPAYCGGMPSVNCGLQAPPTNLPPGYLPMYYPQHNPSMLGDQSRNWQPYHSLGMPADQLGLQCHPLHNRLPPQGFPELTHTTGSVYTAAAMQFLPNAGSSYNPALPQPSREQIPSTHAMNPMNPLATCMDDPSAMYMASRLPLRKSQSAVELNSWRAALPDGDPSLTPGSAADLASENFKVGKLTAEERLQKILRYRQKRHDRNFKRVVKYQCRKTLADSRPRVRGRFARNDDPQSILPHQFKKVLKAKDNSGSSCQYDNCTEQAESVKKEENGSNTSVSVGPVGPSAQDWSLLGFEGHFQQFQANHLSGMSNEKLGAASCGMPVLL